MKFLSGSFCIIKSVAFAAFLYAVWVLRDANDSESYLMRIYLIWSLLMSEQWAQ